MLTIAFVLFALQLSASASPSPAKGGVQRVGLTRRQPHIPTNPVDVKKLAQQVIDTITKYDFGFEAFQENVGQVHPLDGALTNATKRAVNSEPLADDGGALWTGQMSAGTPAQTFTVGFDTGSASLLLVNAACTTTDCQAHRRYNPATSTTGSDRRQTFNLKVTDTQTVSGNQYADTVSVAGLAATGQVLGAANTYPTSFNDYPNPPDGRMGMGYQAISAYKAPSFPQTLVAQRVTTDPVFAFRLGAAGSELTIGGTDPAAITGDITYAPVTTKGFWQVNLDGVRVQNPDPNSGNIANPGQNAVSRTQAIIDTGSALIVGDRANVQRLYDAIPGSQALAEGLYSIPCDAVPVVSLVFGGTAFPIDPTLFNQGPVAVNSNQCVGAVAAAPQTKPPQRFWSVGDIFLQNVYSIFDLGNNRVGFATLAP